MLPPLPLPLHTSLTAVAAMAAVAAAVAAVAAAATTAAVLTKKPAEGTQEVKDTITNAHSVS